MHLINIVNNTASVERDFFFIITSLLTVLYLRSSLFETRNNICSRKNTNKNDDDDDADTKRTQIIN